MKLSQATREDLKWMVDRAACVLTQHAKAMKVTDSAGRIRGMVAYDNFTPGSCQAHMAVESPIAWRRLIPTCFRYPFEYLGLRVAIAVVDSTNARSLTLARTLGFREVARIKDGLGRGQDMVIHEIRPEDCQRWLTPPQEKAA